MSMAQSVIDAIPKWIPLYSESKDKLKDDRYIEDLVSIGILEKEGNNVDINDAIKNSSLIFTWESLYETCEEQIWDKYPQKDLIERVFSYKKE